MIAGADDKFKDIIFDFGLDLGVAFQIQDDVLNLAGDEKVYGKEIGGDLWEGKRTLIAINLIDKASPEHRKYLKNIFDLPRHQKKAEDIDKILNLIREYNCIQYAMESSIELASIAKEKFAKLDGSIDEDQRKLILEMIDFMINRKF